MKCFIILLFLQNLLTCQSVNELKKFEGSYKIGNDEFKNILSIEQQLSWPLQKQIIVCCLVIHFAERIKTRLNKTMLLWKLVPSFFSGGPCVMSQEL